MSDTKNNTGSEKGSKLKTVVGIIDVTGGGSKEFEVFIGIWNKILSRTKNSRLEIVDKETIRLVIEHGDEEETFESTFPEEDVAKVLKASNKEDILLTIAQGLVLSAARVEGYHLIISPNIIEISGLVASKWDGEENPSDFILTRVSEVLAHYYSATTINPNKLSTYTASLYSEACHKISLKYDYEFSDEETAGHTSKIIDGIKAEIMLVSLGIPLISIHERTKERVYELVEGLYLNKDSEGSEEPKTDDVDNIMEAMRTATINKTEETGTGDEEDGKEDIGTLLGSLLGIMKPETDENGRYYCKSCKEYHTLKK